MADDLSKRIDELEVRVAFQDDLLNALNSGVAGFGRTLDEMRAEVGRLREAVEQLRIALGEDIRGEPPPPHY